MMSDVLRGWLDRVGGVEIATVEGPNKSTLRFFTIGRSVAIVQDYLSPNGWELYIPADVSNDVHATLRAAEAALCDGETSAADEIFVPSHDDKVKAALRESTPNQLPGRRY